MRALLDANVLYPFTLRDTLLRAAGAGLCQILWSAEILEETRRNLVESAGVSEPKAHALIEKMDEAFPEARVTGYERLIGSMQNDPKDRHVAAAASHAQAQVIVTRNLKDFRPLPDGVRAESPDQFLLGLLELDADVLLDVLRVQASALKHPPVSFGELLAGLAKITPRFVDAVRAAEGGPARSPQAPSGT